MIVALIRRKEKIRVERIPAIRLIEDLIRSPQNDPKVCAATADAPEEVGILGFGRGHQGPVSGDDHDREERVGCEPVEALQPSDAAADGGAYDAGTGTGAGYYIELAQLAPERLMARKHR